MIMKMVQKRNEFIKTTGIITKISMKEVRFKTVTVLSN